MVVRLNQGARGLENVGLIVDRAIGSSTREELPPELFTSASLLFSRSDRHGLVAKIANFATETAIGLRSAFRVADFLASMLQFYLLYC